MCLFFLAFAARIITMTLQPISASIMRFCMSEMEIQCFGRYQVYLWLGMKFEFIFGDFAAERSFSFWHEISL